MEGEGGRTASFRVDGNTGEKYEFLAKCPNFSHRAILFLSTAPVTAPANKNKNQLIVAIVSAVACLLIP